MKPRKQCIDCGKQLSAGSQYRKFGAPDKCQSCSHKKPASTCIDCGIVISRHQSERCNPCNQKLRVKPLRTCIDCGKELNVNSRYTKTQRCQACHGKDMLGSNHPNWNGGSTPARKQVQNSDAYKTWRINVFNRDDFTCCFCGQHGGKLHAHHMYAFAKFPELRINPDNGETLCIPCHKKLHVMQRMEA